MFKNILGCYDGSSSAQKALRVAVGLAAEQKAELRCLTVEEELPMYVGAVDEVGAVKKERDAYYADTQAQTQRIAAKEGLVLSTYTVTGHPVQAMVEAAKAGGYDLVVMGHTGHSSNWGSFMGTTAEKVARHITCSVLIVR
jgi:nucleotide-binding universal stress UspA family protein